MAKEIARKEAARAAIAMAKEEMRAGLHYADSSRRPGIVQEPSFSSSSSSEFLDPMTEMTLLKQQKRRTKQQQQQQQQQQSQSMRQYHTWQRGAEAVELNKQFPLLKGSRKEMELTPLMYEMMVPRPPMRANLDTPFTELHSSTSSLHSKTHLHIPTH